jgi:cytosine/creatinine deaminase
MGKVSTDQPGCLLLIGAAVPPSLLQPSISGGPHGLVDILVDGSSIAAVGQLAHVESSVRRINLRGDLTISAMVDAHVHIDKAHLCSRYTFPEFGLLDAIAAMEATKSQWTAEDLRRRAEFALHCAWAHGVRALRSHVDWMPSTPPMVREVLSELKLDWASRIDLQLAPLIPLELVDDVPLVAAACDQAATWGGVIGFFVYHQAAKQQRLAKVFALARDRGLDLDFHVDEGLDDDLDGLAAIADLARADGYCGRILCGHCVSLSQLDPEALIPLLGHVRDANIDLITLPEANVYLQDRQAVRSPRLRGLAPLREIATAGINLSVGTDNVRDGFYPFGDHDPLKALALAALVGHLPDAGRAWIQAVTTNPSRALGLATNGRIEPGAPADLIVFAARSSSELFARSGQPRQVMRAGRFIDTTLPSHRLLTPGGAIG